MRKKKKTCKKGGVYESARYLVRRKAKPPKSTPKKTQKSTPLKKMRTRRRVSRIRRTSSAPMKFRTPSRRSINPRPPSELLKYVSNKTLQRKKLRMRNNTKKHLSKARSV